MLSPVPPGMLQYAACLRPRQCSAGCCVGAVLCTPYSLPWQGNAGVERCSALLWGSEKPQCGGEAALRVTAWQNCFLSVNCKNEPSRTATVDHFIYCLCAAGHNRGHWSLLPFIPISDPGSSHLPHRPYTGAWTHPLHLHVVL